MLLSSTYAMIVIPLTAMVLAQTVKLLRFSMRHGFDWNYVFAPGHMPSAHSAFVTALVVSVGYYTGIHTGAFAVACGFATIVIYDALRVRMHIGDQGRFLNRLIQELDTIDRAKFPRLPEHVGHYASEVCVGMLFGILVSTFLIAIVFV